MISRLDLLFAGVALLSPGPRVVLAADDFVAFHEHVMGTSLELRVRADSPEAARRAEARVLDEIARLSGILSGYDASSEFRRWQTSPGHPTPVAPELFDVLALADHWRALTGGAFDARVGALARLWATCAKEDRLPTTDELAAARALMSRQAWRLNPAKRTAERLSDCPLTLDGIAKGYIVERACAAALDPRQGVRGVLLNVGGDLRVCGAMDGPIGLAPPRGDSESAEPLTFIEVRDRSVATSGDWQRGFRIQGRWYSHILNPATGQPADHVIAATVIAPGGADADALATALNVLPVVDGLRLADSLPDVACRIVSSDGRVWHSRDWARYEPARPLVLAAVAADLEAQVQDAPKAAPADGWGDAFEMAVRFEIDRPPRGERPYRRPYVVIWAEDEQGRTVRTILLWVSLGGAGPDQWLPDLARWYRDDPARSVSDKKNLIYTIARPTRPPGQYSVVWDGKDDDGKPVARGRYTLSLETAREHGTHQLIRKTLTLGNEPFVEELKGNVELKSATIEYRRKGPAK